MLLNVSNSTAELIFPMTNGPAGTFTSSDEAITFAVSTNNISGYTVKYVGEDDAGTLSHTERNFEFTSISSPLTADAFAASANTAYNNQWGIKPNKYVSGNTVVDNVGDDSVFLPTPTTSGVTIDQTSAPNSTANNYSIEIGARADFSIRNGEYVGYYNLTVVANPVLYGFSFNAGNTTDTVSGLPDAQNNATSEAVITLPDNIPTRAHYSFIGWCDVLPTTTNGVDSCVGTNAQTGNPATQYVAGGEYGINQTTSNNAILYAMWQIDTFTCAKQYRLQNANGTWGDYVEDGTETINYGGTCNYAKTVTNYKNAADGVNDAEASTSAANMADDATLSLDLYRNTYSLAVVAGDNVSNPTGAGTYRWGDLVTIGVTKTANATCTAYAEPAWTHSGVAGGFGTTVHYGNTYYLNYTMGMGDVTFTANSAASDVAQTITLSRSADATSIKIDDTDYEGESASLLCGTHNISSTLINDTYYFTSWSGSDGVTVTDSDTISTTITVAGPGELALNIGRLAAMQDVTEATCPTTAQQVYDVRDNEIYTVQKLADGKCWLLDNLRLDLADADVQNNLTSSTTNASDATLNYLKNGGGTTADQYPTAGVRAWISDSYSVPQVDTTAKEATSPTGYAAGKFGAYYNYCAASAGSYCYGEDANIGTSTGDAVEDICPSGWRLPTGGESGEYQALYDAYSGDFASFVNALRTPLSGYHTLHRGNRGYYFSSTRLNDQFMYRLDVLPSSIGPVGSEDRNGNISVRCVAK